MAAMPSCPDLSSVDHDRPLEQDRSMTIDRNRRGARVDDNRRSWHGDMHGGDANARTNQLDNCSQVQNACHLS